VNIALAKLPFLTESKQQQFFKIAIITADKRVIVDNDLQWDSQIATILFNCSDRETYDL